MGCNCSTQINEEAPKRMDVAHIGPIQILHVDNHLQTQNDDSVDGNSYCNLDKPTSDILIIKENGKFVLKEDRQRVLPVRPRQAKPKSYQQSSLSSPSLPAPATSAK